MKLRLLSSCIAGAFGVLAHCNGAAAVTLNADADTFIQLGAATTNFGASTGLTIKDSGSQSFTRKAYVRFDVSGMSLTDLVAASFDLVVSDRSAGSGSQQSYPIQIFGLLDGNAGENWIEGNGGADNLPANEITWNNAPANTLTSNAFGAAATLLGSFSVPGTAVPGDVFTLANANLLNFIKADTNGVVTLMIRRNGGESANNLSFASSENTTLPGPRLTLAFIPEPATMSLLGLAGVTLLRRRRLA